MSSLDVTPGEDHAVDIASVVPGQFLFEYGYIPCIAFAVADGQVEVARFAGFDYLDPGNLSVKRGPLPAIALPAQASASDRVAALEEQVAALVALLQDRGVTPPAPAAQPPDTPPEAVGVSSPFTVAQTPSTTGTGVEPDGDDAPPPSA